MEVINERGGNQPQQMDGEGEKISWFHQMGLHVCLGLVHVLLEHTPFNEQGLMHGVMC
jgi:hypothetical protein